MLLPFNLSKALINSAIAMVIYKPLSTALGRIGFSVGNPKKMTFNRASVIILSVGLLFVVAAVILLLGIPD